MARRSDKGGVVALALAAIVCAVAAPSAAAQAPDPGGNADAPVPVPPTGRYFGLNETIGQPTQALTTDQLAELASGAGANAIRSVLSWQAIEPERDAWSAGTWRPFDDLYASARAAGLTPILILTNAPSWARTLLGKLCLLGPQCAYPPRPEMDGEWSQFAAEAARRYPDAIFEVWNEPNLSGHWQSGPDPERYARLQVVAHDAIKGVNPDATVLSAGFANTGHPDFLSGVVGGLLGRMGMREFVARAYAAPDSIKGHVDALAFHPYPGQISTGSTDTPDLGAGSGFARGFAEIRAVRDAAGDTDVPLFVTETGISTQEGVDRAGQVAATQRIYRKLMTMDDVMGVVFHRLLEAQDIQILEAGFAWMRPNTSGPPSPWPVYCAFATAAGNSHPDC